VTRRSALALALRAALLGVAAGPAAASVPSAVEASSDAVEVIRRDAAGSVAWPWLEAAGDGSYLLSADFDVPLTPALTDALEHGVPLYFVADFELRLPRWWWFDARVVTRETTWRLSYHALTRQYRLTRDGIIRPFDSATGALAALAGLRGWRVIEAGEVEPGQVYEARVRLRLDTAQLPKPFQIGGLTPRDWEPQAEWKRFEFRP